MEGSIGEKFDSAWPGVGGGTVVSILKAMFLNRMVYTPFTRSMVVPFSLTPSAAYAAGNSVGGTIPLDTALNTDGLPPLLSTKVRFNRINIGLITTGAVGSGVTAMNGYGAFVFPSAPPCNPVNGVTPVPTKDDSALRPVCATMTGLASSGTQNILVVGTVPAGSIVTDPTGKLYLMLLSSGVNTITNPDVCAGWAELLY